MQFETGLLILISGLTNYIQSEEQRQMFKTISRDIRSRDVGHNVYKGSVLQPVVKWALTDISAGKKIFGK